VQFEDDDVTSESLLEKRTVWLAVWHSDHFGRNVFLGDSVVPLYNYEFEGKPIWYPLQQQGREVSTTVCTIQSHYVVKHVNIKMLQQLSVLESHICIFVAT